MTDVRDEIWSKARQWVVDGNDRPNCAILPVDKYHEMVRTLLSYGPNPSGVFTWQGMDLYASGDLTEVKVGRVI